MAQLEEDYPGVTFVYMTGHLEYGYESSIYPGNQMIRDFCIENNKVLYDFADIESHNPDGVYFPYADDDCDYFDGPGGTKLGNWALEWQSSHSEGLDWFDCYSPHSQPLNANLKAYAAWWLFAALGGWNDTTPIMINSFQGRWMGSGGVHLRWDIFSDESIVGFKIYRRVKGVSVSEVIHSGEILSPETFEYIDDNTQAGNTYVYTLSVVKEDLSEIQSQSIEIGTKIPSISLLQNYPNPFKTSTELVFQIPEPARIDLKVYNILGQEVVTLVDEVKPEGAHNITWDGRDASGQRLSSGIYFYRLKTDNFTQTRKMVLIQ
jgi:hypothetical protein